MISRSSDKEIGEDDRVKEDGVDTIEEEKQGDEAEEKDQVAGELVKKQGARKRQFKPTVGAGGTSVLRMVQAPARKRTAAKAGTCQGDSSKQLEEN
ncbi:hypothetical protein Bca4012_008225 [Brassica carinata]|uniref:Uncharacterized protein n=1 Tax=Brassica carinata TaxID=52824 RepID=A0A8X7RQG9_BRACI|nr:hypothetical protein Bca52824_038891 [Brassica carinata]